MPRPKRSEIFTPNEVSILHVVQRCVRRAYLSGVDEVTGKDFSYRKEWIRQRIEKLASVFDASLSARHLLCCSVPGTCCAGRGDLLGYGFQE